MRIVVVNHITLDGVMQSPGRADEDTRGDFAHGGWANARSDEAMTQAVGERMGTPGGGMLLGRRSYEDMLGYWNSRDSPFKDGLNNAPKYVASRTLREPLPWPNSTLLEGDAGDAVEQLKRRAVGDLYVMGSGELIATLMRRELIDEYLLFIHPIVLGEGRRMFAAGAPPADLRLVDSTTTSKGVVMTTYRTLVASGRRYGADVPSRP
jgi:dihydrofolate reductase